MIFCAALSVLTALIISVTEIKMYRNNYNKIYYKNRLSSEKIVEKCNKYDKTTAILFLLSGLVIFPTSCFLLEAIMYIPFHAMLKWLYYDAIYITYPFWIYWLCLPCFLLSFPMTALGFELMAYIRYGKDEYLDYLYYEYAVFPKRLELKRRRVSDEYRFDGRKTKERFQKTIKENTITFMCLSVIVCLICIVFTDVSRAFGKDYIQIGLMKNYRLNEVENIYYVEKYRAPIGSVIDESYFVIEFSDGRTWNNRYEFGGFEKYVDYLHDECGIEITETEFYSG